MKNKPDIFTEEVALQIGTRQPPELGSYLPTKGRQVRYLPSHLHFIKDGSQLLQRHSWVIKLTKGLWSFQKDLDSFQRQEKILNNDQISKVNALRKRGEVASLSSTGELSLILKVYLSLHFLIILSDIFMASY